MNDYLNNLYIDIKRLKDIFNESLIVIDTNVLLMAYQWRDTTFKQVFEILDELSKEGRLKIPAQVLKEFAHQRPITIRDLSNDLHNKILSKLDRGKAEHHSLDKVIPSLEFIDNRKKLLESEKKYNDALESVREAQKEYKKTLNELLNYIKEYLDKDPITERFKRIFEKSCLDDLKLSEESLKSELESRKKKNIPPGYRDKGHLGDMIIWSEILELNADHVIFITRDNKNDWVYKDNTGKVMGARRELVEEFYTSNKKTFKIMTPLDFIETYLQQKGERVEETVRADIEKNSNVDILKIEPSNLDYQAISQTIFEKLNNEVKHSILISYANQIKEKIDLLLYEKIVDLEEYNYISKLFRKANEFKIDNLDGAKQAFDSLDIYIQNILDEVFG